ncbi:MAG: lamin tail domain-containing protein, partial [Deltaproteobacteria bacterium]|nr:lamin tail domain-containing protein [Deltaproteobacteria bacterium]
TCQGNDDFTHWCPAVKGDGQNKGTPGQRNSYCRKVMCVPQDAACNDRAEEREARRPGPGEVIISEIMPNASCTPEKDQEWFEVYNTTDRELDLIHLGLYTRSAPGAPRFRISDAEMRCFTVPPRGHRVIVSKKDPVPPSGIASCFSYNGGLALSNSNGVLELRLPDDVTVVDSISWKSSVDGRSLELDPAPECMSAAGNDGSACWHVSPRPQQELCGVLGYHTAGVANEPPDACFCQEEDGAWIRIPQSFAPGELAITEFLSDVPGPEADGAGMEWVELSSLVEGYLNCGKLFVGNTAREFPWTWCWALEPGRPVVLAASTDPQQNCGLTTNLPAEQVRQLGPLSLTARGGSLVLQLQGVEVDAVRNYAAGGEGHSLQQDATGRWCPSDQPIATCQAPDGSPRMFGTPGQANLDCPAEPLPPVQEGFCRPEGVAEVRAVVPPPSGAVIVSEFFANPAGPESNKEWLELYVAQGGPYDLNWLRLQLQDDAAAVLTAEHCVTVQQGDWVLLAKSDDPALNGGLPPPRLRFNKSLLNSNIAIRLLAQDGVTLIDGMSYAPPSVEDKSVQLSSSKLDAAENDLVGSWCPSAEDGTPGAANVECAAQ